MVVTIQIVKRMVTSIGHAMLEKLTTVLDGSYHRLKPMVTTFALKDGNYHRFWT